MAEGKSKAVPVKGVAGSRSFHPGSFVWRCKRVFWGSEEVVWLFLYFLRVSHIEVCWWSVGPTSWAASCVMVESSLPRFLLFVTCRGHLAPV